MVTDIIKLLFRRGLRSELASYSLDVGEPGFTTDTNQLFIGTEDAINEIQFDPFANAHSVIQAWLDSPENPEPGLVVDEDLIIRDVVDVDAVLLSMEQSASFAVDLYARPRRNVEVITENSFNQLFADQHLTSLDSSTGLRSSLFKKELTGTSGTFLRYNKNVCTSFIIDYSLKQTDDTVMFVRVGTIRIINGVPMGITQCKLTDDNTEIWQDLDIDNVSDLDEFSNIGFSCNIVGDDVVVEYTQDAGFMSEVSYTVKRWSM
jgi:hypothetical protein